MKSIWESIEKWLSRIPLLQWVLSGAFLLFGVLKRMSIMQCVLATLLGLITLVIVPAVTLYILDRLKVRGQKMVTIGSILLCLAVVLAATGGLLFYIGTNDGVASTENKTSQPASIPPMPEQTSTPIPPSPSISTAQPPLLNHIPGVDITDSSEVDLDIKTNEFFPPLNVTRSKDVKTKIDTRGWAPIDHVQEISTTSEVSLFSQLTNQQLRDRVHTFANKLLAFGTPYEQKETEEAAKWQARLIPSGKYISEKKVRDEAYEKEYREHYLNEAAALRYVALTRLGFDPKARSQIERTQGFPMMVYTIDFGSVGGSHDFTDAGDYLNALADRLPINTKNSP